MFYSEDFDNKFNSKNEKGPKNPSGKHRHGFFHGDERRMYPNHGNFPDKDPYDQYHDGYYPGRDETELPPPPRNIPSKQTSAYAVNPRSIKNCVRSYTYVWLSNGSEFWIYPTYIGRSSISGYRWNGRYGWVYFGVDTDMIESFYCLPY